MTRPVRKTLRAPAEFLGTLEVLTANESGLAYGIRVVDVSSAGVGITLRGEIPLGTQVRLIFETGTVEGTLVYCRPEKGHFAAGVRVDRNATALLPLRWAASLKLHDAVSSWPKTHIPV
ncbi:MAG: PilZ domain-containing protein [Paludibaculum sp.]